MWYEVYWKIINSRKYSKWNGVSILLHTVGKSFSDRHRFFMSLKFYMFYIYIINHVFHSIVIVVVIVILKVCTIWRIESYNFAA